MKKNTAGQYWRVYAEHRNTGVPATGIAATITATINKDFAGEVAVGSGANPTEIGGGYYDFALTQAETNAYQLSLKPTTTTNGVQVRACPETLTTETAAAVEPAAGSDWTSTKAGYIDVAISSRGTGTSTLSTTDLDARGVTTANKSQTGDSYAEVSSATYGLSKIKTDTGNIVSRITATLFSGITSLANWLGALAGKTADTATRAEINATTAGAGYNETTDSQEAIADAQLTAAQAFAAVLTTQMTEAYAADGVPPTLAQAIFLIQQSLHEFSISGTTRTVKKLDGLTTAATFTLDDADAPTSTTRAS